MSWAGLNGSGISLTESVFESARFECTVARFVVGQRSGLDAAESVTRLLETSAADLIICRWPGDRTTIAAAAARSTRVLLPADVLSYWEAPAAGLRQESRSNGLDVTVQLAERATAATAALLETVIVDSFRGYGNHYAANPCLDDERALRGYVEWAQRSLEAEPENVMLMFQGGKPIGIATLSRDGDDLEIELAGLVAEHQGKGLYGSLLAAIEEHAARLGCARVIISTQVHNVRVQRAWVRAGFKPFATVMTTHAMTQSFWESRSRNSLPTTGL